MSFFEKHKLKIIFGAIVIVSLVGVFLWGGNAPKTQTVNTAVTETPSPTVTQTDEPAEETPDTEQVYEAEGDIEYSIEHDEYQTEPVPEGVPVPVEPQSVEVTDKKLTCTLSIRCDTILNNMSYLKKGKESLIPSDGIILPPKTVTFSEGENVFNVLMRETKRNNIHTDHTTTAAYNSAYIRAINNIYEFDCGELSGWRYKVNGNIINYGCSRYVLHDGDVIEWVYTCNMGEDLK